MLAPRVEFPTATYTQASTEGGRTCAVTATGAVTCCGRTDTKLGTAPKTALRQIAVAREFTCGLDAAGSATCWGSVTTAPKAAFTKLGGRIVKREQGSYEIANVPQHIRSAGKGPIATKYDRVTFDLSHVQPGEL